MSVPQMTTQEVMLSSNSPTATSTTVISISKNLPTPQTATATAPRSSNPSPSGHQQDFKLAPNISPDSTVHVVVGASRDYPQPARFPVHCEILCYWSPYFRENLRSILQRRKSFTKKMPNSDLEIRVKLPDRTPEFRIPDEIQTTPYVFTAFLEWLYNGPMVFFYNPPMIKPEILIQLWVFAGQIGIPTCQNACIEGIEAARARSGIIETAWLVWTYEHTSADCALRRLLTDQCVWLLDHPWLRLHVDQFPREVLQDLVERATGLVRFGGACHFTHLKGRRSRYWIPELDQMPEKARLTA